MKKLELIKGLSYSTRNFSAVKGEPFCVDEDVAKGLMLTGRFKELETISDEDMEKIPDEDLFPVPDGKEENDKPIDKMKKEELIAYAESNGIDISACQNNEERIAAIKAAMTVGEEAKAGFEE